MPSAAASWRWTADFRGRLLVPSSYFMKSPPQQFPDDVAHDMVEEFIRDEPSGSGERDDRPSRRNAAREAWARLRDLGPAGLCLSWEQSGPG